MLEDSTLNRVRISWGLKWWMIFQVGIMFFLLLIVCVVDTKKLPMSFRIFDETILGTDPHSKGAK